MYSKSIDKLGKTHKLALDTDVLVVGGGPAALWAAMTAREQGARVALVDKGFAGTSGVAAAATAGHWWVEPQLRAQAIEACFAGGGQLGQRSWMARVLELTWQRWPRLAADIGHPNPSVHRGQGYRTVEGPVYLRALRRRVAHSGVRILDHAPALELLVDSDGAVAGAAGLRRQQCRTWEIEAGAVVIATGGCAWRSASLGSNVNTGDGHLMGAEVGAHLSGLEFSNYYGVVPAGTTMDKNGLYPWATFSSLDDDVIATGWDPLVGAIGPDVFGASLIRAGQRGPLFAILDRATEAQRAAMRAAMPNYFMVFDRLGIDPFRERFELGFVLEGTVRGTGGLAVMDEYCWTGVAGLWVAGDAASRERIVGAASGAGAANAAWTISSGTWAGAAAAEHAAGLRREGDRRPRRRLRPAGRTGLRPHGGSPALWRELSLATQEELLPTAKNGLRHERSMAPAAAQLERLWQAAAAGLRGRDAREVVWARETAAMIATGRWAYASARARTETRGMHVRDDFPQPDPEQRDRVESGGLDSIWTRRVALDATAEAVAVAR